MIFNKDQILNTRVKIRTKKIPDKDLLQGPYNAKDYNEILLETSTAINLNHTSLFVAEKLCNALPDEIWTDVNLPNYRFFDLFGDSGFLEKYLISKLRDNEVMIKAFPDEGQRVFHILHNMIFAIAKTHAASLWLRKIVYYSSDARISGYDKNGRPDNNFPAIFAGRLFSIGYDQDKLDSYKKDGNIKSPWIEGEVGENNIFSYPMLEWIKKVDVDKEIKDKNDGYLDYICRIFWDCFTDEDYKKISEDRRKEIMIEIKKELLNKPKVIIGNPPYNLNDEETGQVGETVYNYFCLAADALKPEYESFIIPSKWAYGKARIPNLFPQSILCSKNVVYLELIDGDDAFPSVSTGEISIYSKNNTEDSTKFVFNNYGKLHEYREIKEITYDTNGKRWLKPVDSIIEKIQAKISKSLADDTKAISISSDNIYDIYGHDALDGAVAFKYDYGKDVVYPDGTKGKKTNI